MRRTEMVTGVIGKGEESDQTDYCSNCDYAEVQRGPGDRAGKGAADHAEASHTCEQGPAHERALQTEGAGAGQGSVAATSHQWKVSSVLVALGRNE